MKNLLLIIFLITSLNTFGQNIRVIENGNLTYGFKSTTNIGEHEDGIEGHFAYSVVKYQIVKNNKLINAGYLPLPKRHAESSVVAVDIQVTESDVIVVTSQMKYVFKFKLDEEGIMRKIQ